MKHAWKTSSRCAWRTTAGLLCVAFLITSCSSASVDSSSATASQPPVRDAEGILAPIEPNDRNPIPEHFDSRNSSTPVPTGVTFEEFERLRATYVIPSDLTLASSSSRAAARAFGAMLVSAFLDPEPSALNMSLPGHASLVPLPASLNFLGRAALYERLGASGVDVGPSKPDINNRVWVAIFQGASGPIGSVVSACFGVTLHSVNNMVLIEVIQIPSRLQRQPASLTDYPVVLCELDLNNPPVAAPSADY